MSATERKLRVFLCHASQDKPVVRELYQRLNAEGWIDPWLDEKKILPGEDWQEAIEKAIRNSDVIVVVLSKSSLAKEGYVQKEIQFAINVAQEKIEQGFIIPLRIDDVRIPKQLRDYEYLNLQTSDKIALLVDRLKEKHVTGKEIIMTASTSFDFYLYRMKLAFSEQKNLFGQEELSRAEIIKRIITDKPSSELRKGNFWHVGNVKFASDYGGYFAVGKTTKSILEKYDEETGDFVEEVDETSPYTHVVFDAEIGLFSIAKKLRLSQTINGIANKLKTLFQNSDMAFRYGLTISLDPISDPKDFIEALESAYNIRSFTVTFTRSNPFDVDEHFQKPMEKYLDAANGTDGATTVKGDDLNSETLIAVTKSVAATGNDAKAYLKPSQKERLIRKSLKGNPAYFSLSADEFTEELALSRARKLYKTVRGSDQS